MEATLWRCKQMILKFLYSKWKLASELGKLLCIFSFRRYSFIMRQMIGWKTSHKLNNRLRCVWGICQPSLHQPYSINATLIERLLLTLLSSSPSTQSVKHTHTLTKMNMPSFQVMAWSDLFYQLPISTPTASSIRFTMAQILSLIN